MSYQPREQTHHLHCQIQLSSSCFRQITGKNRNVKRSEKREPTHQIKEGKERNGHVAVAVQLNVYGEIKDWKWEQSILPPVKEEPGLIAAPPLQHGGQNSL